MLHDRGGWLSRNTALAFAEYAEVVSRRLGDRVKRWITLNEPFCAAYLGYGIGKHAPGLRDPQSAFIAAHHLLLGHGLAVARIRANVPQAQVGLRWICRRSMPPMSARRRRRRWSKQDRFKNRWFLDPLFRGSYPEQLFAEQHVAPPPIQDGDMASISTPTEFLGVNYYLRDLIRYDAEAPGSVRRIYPVPGSTYTAMGWEVYPQGLTELLARLQRDYAPAAIYITENGAAYEDEWDGGDQIDDHERQQYLAAHIGAVGRAIEMGVPVRGYFVWSLMDNFEWGKGTPSGSDWSMSIIRHSGASSRTAVLVPRLPGAGATSLDDIADLIAVLALFSHQSQTEPDKHDTGDALHRPPDGGSAEEITGSGDDRGVRQEPDDAECGMDRRQRHRGHKDRLPRRDELREKGGIEDADLGVKQIVDESLSIGAGRAPATACAGSAP